MAMKIGILTSGGDCPGLNAAIRGVVRAAYGEMDVEVYGIHDGFTGLINGEYSKMSREDFSGILTLGGTILGTSRQPFKAIKSSRNSDADKVAAMKENYAKMGLDALFVLGGNGTHKTANLLSEEGLNVIALPKTIDNDIFGTDVTFGFHTAVDIATDVIDRIHTTATSHGRIMVIEIMGNKAGWLTLYSGMAGGADIILLPEIPFDIKSVVDAIKLRIKHRKKFSIVAIAEGAMDKNEAKLSRKERIAQRAQAGFPSISYKVAKQIEEMTNRETRVVVPGHIQRGGTPSSYDRVLSTRFGVHAAMLLRRGKFGYTVALDGKSIIANKLSEVAGKLKNIPQDHPMIDEARKMGVSLGD